MKPVGAALLGDVFNVQIGIAAQRVNCLIDQRAGFLRVCLINRNRW